MSWKKLKLNGFTNYPFIYEFIKWTGALPMLLFLRLRVKFVNKKAYKSIKGGFIVSSNHRPLIDPFILCCAFPSKRLYFIAQEGLFSSPLKAWMFTQFNCIKIDRTNADIETFRGVGRVLKKGHTVCIFPEGRIESEKGGGFKGGCAMMSLTNNVPILPIHLEMRRNFLCRCKATVGEPIYPDDVVGASRSLMSIDKLNDYIFEKEQELKNNGEKGR